MRIEQAELKEINERVGNQKEKDCEYLFRRWIEQ